MKKEYEMRRLDSKELRAETMEVDGKRYLVGKIPYESLSIDLGGFKEKIQRGAFNKTLSDGYDVKALLNHSDSHILGRIKNSTLKFEDRDDGLYATVELGNQSYANDLWESVTRDDVSTMSFGFRVIKDDYKEEERRIIRTLKEVHLVEVSFGVTFPAYAETDSQAVYRSVYKRAGLDFDQLNAVLIKANEGLELSSEEQENLIAVQDLIRNLIPQKEEIVESPKSTPISVLEEELALLEKEI